jgi:hypothetical protein
MKTIRIYSPEGCVAATGDAPALSPVPPLTGRRIAVLDNGKAGADRLLSRMAERLAHRTGAEFVGSRRKGSAATPCEPDLVDRLAREVQVVLTGTAD